MIEKVTVKNVATYDHVGVTFQGLKKINVVYGNNGSGKTTFSEVLRKNDDSPECTIEWKNRKMYTYVYNRNFVKENFLQGPIRGIFTLGKDSVETQLKISKLKEKITAHEQEIDNLQGMSKEKTKELEELVKNFTQACWKIKNDIDSDFKELIKGVRNSQEKFMQKCLEEAQNNRLPLVPLDEIISRKESLFDRATEEMQKKPILNIERQLENDPIFETKIIGREDVDIAALINKLQISDWVNQGKLILKHDVRVCPFCQQDLPTYFEDKLSMYFDQTYETQMKYLTDFSRRFIEHNEKIVSDVNRILNDGINSFINKEKLNDILNILTAKFEENKLLIEQKLREPSRSVKLANSSELVSTMNEEIEASNKKVDEYNLLIANFKTEKEKLVKAAWRYIVELNTENLKSYLQTKGRLDRTLASLTEGIQKKTKYKDDFKRELVQFQAQVTSIQYSVEEINRILTSFGFKNFKLEAASEKGNYKIIRDNGEDANETLSEGEKTFITFLYFYQLLKGSNNSEEFSTEKVVVIDDPISSLDTSVLFMVSSLVRQIMFDVKNNTSDIKQIILLTHNIYFHKEVTYNQGKKSFGEGAFWILRKKDNISSAEYYPENPIKTSYELLWKELRNVQDQSLITVQNTMRRIIENYYKFFGNMDLDKLEDYFEFEEKMICRSLLSWLNDGSHSINEDLYVESNIDLIDRYKEVFRAIFIKTNHGAHYAMMMNEVAPNESLRHIREELSQGIREAAGGSA
jgi:wobble nucleotide-excising tRNase